jgi:hypothetical protein
MIKRIHLSTYLTRSRVVSPVFETEGIKCCSELALSEAEGLTPLIS